MPQSFCLNCMSQSLRNIQYAPPNLYAQALQHAAFSTTATLAKSPLVKKKPSGEARSARPKGMKLRLKSKIAEKSGKPPAPGERKAQRKRVVLSNVNAPEVRGLQGLNAENVRMARLESMQNYVLAFENDSVDALRAMDAFKTTQGWGSFRKPATVIRKETVELAQILDQARAQKEQNKSARIVLVGEKSSGKSVLQLQTMAIAQKRGWVLIHVPDAVELVDGSTSYQPARDSAGNIHYIQPDYTAKLLGSIAKANAKILSKLRLSREHNFPKPVQSNISLDRLLELGAQDTELSVAIWQVFLEEMTNVPQDSAKHPRPPMLLTIDGLGYMMRDSEYLNAQLQKIHAHDLSLVASLRDLLSGATPMKNGGMVLACISDSKRASTPDMDHVLAKKIEKAGGKSAPNWTSWTAPDERITKVFDTVDVRKVAGLAKEEAKAIMEYYALSGMMRTAITDNLVNEKWAVCGGGIVGEIEKSCMVKHI